MFTFKKRNYTSDELCKWHFFVEKGKRSLNYSVIALYVYKNGLD